MIYDLDTTGSAILIINDGNDESQAHPEYERMGKIVSLYVRLLGFLLVNHVTTNEPNKLKFLTEIDSALD